MADRLIRAQVTLPIDDALPENYVTNTWHFDDDDDPLAGWEDSAGWVETALTTFYQAVDGAILGGTLATPATVKLYDMRDPEPRVVKSTFTITLAPNGAAGGTLPHEVALCMSFGATPTSGLNQARRRGRIFLGPISHGAQEIVNGQPRPTAAAMTAVAAAAATLIDGVEHPASPGLHLKWAVYSPTTDLTSSVDDAFNDVTQGWVDNAFDTIRSRGPQPSARTTFS